MKALSLRQVMRSLVFGCAVLVAAWLVLALSAGGTYAAAPSDPSPGKAPDLVGCWSAYGVPVVPDVYTAIKGVDALSPSDVWTAGEQGTGSGGVRPRIHHWNGSDWSIMLSPTAGFRTGLNTVDALSPNEVWVAGESDSASFVMRWDGTQWSIIPSPNVLTSDNILRDVDAVAPDDVWAVGYYHAPGRTETLPSTRWTGSS